MALKKTAKTVKKTVSKTAPKKSAPVKRRSVSKVVEKRAVAKPVVRLSNKPEPPSLDHALKLGPLFLGAGHGHLARPVDKPWLDALDRYINAVAEATDYESKRSAQARASMVLTFGRQLQTLMQNVTLRVQALAQEPQAARLLIEKLVKMNAVLGEMVGSKGIAPIGDSSIPSGQLQTLEQMHRAHFNNIARIADLERSVGAAS